MESYCSTTRAFEERAAVANEGDDGKDKNYRIGMDAFCIGLPEQ